MGIKTEGFEEFADKLKDLERRARDLDGEHEVPADEMFSPGFMRRYSDFSSFDQMLEESPWEVESNEAFEAIPDSEWDQYVASRTRFDSWNGMRESAAAEWTKGQLGL